MFFFFNDTATTEIYTLSLHDALPILAAGVPTTRIEAALPPGTPVVRVMPNTPALVDEGMSVLSAGSNAGEQHLDEAEDRKSTRLNSSHANISYAVFCLKKKKKNRHII